MAAGSRAADFLSQSLAIKHWTSVQGLAQDAVLAMLQSHDGYLWLGTEAGLSRFDGVRFLTYDQRNTPALASDLILSLAEDRNGTIWIGTSGGGLHQMRQGSILHCTGPLAHVGHTIYSLAVDADNAIWIGTERGLSVVRGTQVRHFTEQEGVPEMATYSVAPDDHQGVWFATYGRGLGYWGNEKASLWTKRNGLADDRVVLVARPDQETVLVSCYGGQLMRFAEGRFEKYGALAGANKNHGIWAISKAPGNTLAVGSFGAGLGMVEGKSMRFLPSSAGVTAAIVWSLMKDREDNLWAGTSEGLFQLRSLPVQSFTQKDGLPSNNIWAVWQDPSNKLLIGTDAGWVRFDPQQRKAAGQNSALTAQHVTTIAEDQRHSLWLGTADQGLWRLPKNAVVPTRVEGPWGVKHIHALAVIRKNNAESEEELWIGTFEGGLFSCRPSTNAALFCHAVKEVSSRNVMSILSGREGAVWVGTRDGLDEWKQGKWRHFSANDGLKSSNIASLFEDEEGTLWIGTEKGGLGRYRNGQVTWLSTADGLLDDSIYSILEDKHGRLWMGSTRGIFWIKKSEASDHKQQPINSIAYGLSDGLLSTECTEDTPHAAARASDGSFWFGTVKGLARIDVDSVPDSKTPPPVLIEQLKLDGAPATTQAGRVSVSPDTRHIEASYTGLSFTGPENQMFRYKLEGFDNGWIDAGPLRVASYTNLPAGHYALVVQARSTNSGWNTQGARLLFEVRPHFWATTWFFSIIAIAIVSSIIVFYRLRVRLIRHEFSLVLAERMRGVRARERINAEHTAELARMNVSLRDNLVRLASGTDLQTIMEQILSTAVEQLQAESSCIFIYDEPNGTIERAFTAGSAVPFEDTQREAYFTGCPRVVKVERLPIWHFFQKEKEIVLLDIDNEQQAALLWPEAIAWHKEKGQPMALGVPLFLGTRMLGFMGINFSIRFSASEFSSERKNLANSLGALASMAIESHRLSLRARDAAAGEQRARLSEEMHDGIQQLFTAISFQLGSVLNMAGRAKSAAELMPQIERTAEIAEHGLREARRSIDALKNAATLSEAELIQSLEKLCRSSDSSQTTCILKIFSPLNLPTSPRLNELYRIAQEAVNNACRYAKASAIEIQLERRGNSLQFSILDNGQGFDVNHVNGQGNGLRNLRQRAKRVKGEIAISSTPGATQILVTIPNVTLL